MGYCLIFSSFTVEPSLSGIFKLQNVLNNCIRINLIRFLKKFWLHTEIFGKLGPLEWILNTPSHHRVHHGRWKDFDKWFSLMFYTIQPLLCFLYFIGSNKFCLDKNYGAWLIIWDRMFGTFQEEKEDEEIIYGLVDQQVESFNPLYLQVRFGKLMRVY